MSIKISRQVAFNRMTKDEKDIVNTFILANKMQARKANELSITDKRKENQGPFTIVDLKIIRDDSIRLTKRLS